MPKEIWNSLLIQYCHYKLLITSREIDWYNYSGDLSNIQSLKVIKPAFEEKEWIYSKSVELLTEPEDAGYLAAETQGLQTNISEMLRLLQDKLPSKDVNWLTEICNSVFSGKSFDDTMFNNVIAHFVQMKTGQKRMLVV